MVIKAMVMTITLVVLSSCGLVHEYPDEAMDKGKNLCENNGGVYRWRVKARNRLEVICKNGLSVEYVYFMQTKEDVKNETY